MNESPGEILIVMTSFSVESDALRVARSLVEDGDVACAQIETGRVRSIYGWKGEVHDDDEYLLRLKTSVEREAAVVSKIRALHSYEVPEVVWWRAQAHADYCDWVRERTSQGQA